MGIGVGACVPRGNSTGTELMQKMVAGHFVQDYDAMQGHSEALYLYPMRANRLYTNQPMYFDRDNRLKGRLLTCLELVDGSQIASYGGVDMPTNFANAWVTLCDDCGKILAEFPISRANRALNGGKNFFFRKLPVDWGKSYIVFTSVAGLSSSGFLFNMWTTAN